MVSATSTGSKILVIGDPRYLLIVDHVGGMEIEVIQHLIGANRLPTDQRDIWAAFRNTSAVVNPAAFRTLTVA